MPLSINLVASFYAQYEFICLFELLPLLSIT